MRWHRRRRVMQQGEDGAGNQVVQGHKRRKLHRRAGMPSEIPVFKPGLGDEELAAVEEVFQSGWLGTGPKTEELEEKFAARVGAGYAVALNSCTAALHLSCLAAALGPDDEVLVPSLTFVSTAHAASYCGAKVVFVDVDAETCNLDVNDLRRKISSRSAAIIPVHYGGHPCEMDAIWSLADEHGLAVIEDAAHACGALYRGRPIGTDSPTLATCFSFNATKNICAGDGGVVTTNSAAVAERIRELRWLGIGRDTYQRTKRKGVDPAAAYRWSYRVDSLGLKYAMNDVTAAITLVQLARQEEMQQARETMALQYRRSLEDFDWLKTPVEKPYARTSWHLFFVRTPHRDELQRFLRKRKIATSVHYFPVHQQPYYRGHVSLPVTEKLSRELLSLPFHPRLQEAEVTRVLDGVREFSTHLE